MTIENASDVEAVLVCIEDQEKTLMGVSEPILKSVTPGGHAVTAIGKKGGVDYRNVIVIEVNPGTMSTVSFSLPTL